MGTVTTKRAARVTGCQATRGAATPGTPGAPRREVPDASMVAGLVTLTDHEASYVDPP